MKRIVFLVNTEYHLIISLGIINHYFSDGYNCCVIRVSPLEKKRLNGLDFSGTRIEYREIIYDYDNPTPELKLQLKEIINLRPSQLFFFLEGKFWMNYLFKELHRNGTKIILGPDGMKVYNNHFYKSRKELVFSFLKGCQLSLRAGIYTSLPHVEMCYATSPYIDEVWMEHPEYYNNITNKSVYAFSYSTNNDFVSLLNRVFQAQDDELSCLKRETILFIDSAFSSDEYYDRTLTILSDLRRCFPNRHLLIKPHPLTIEKSKRCYSSIDGCAFFEQRYPAELLIANSNDSLVVSMVSTSELFYNQNCKYYWLYPMYSDMYAYNNLVNPTNHIKVISSVNDIVTT